MCSRKETNIKDADNLYKVQTQFKIGMIYFQFSTLLFMLILGQIER